MITKEVKLTKWGNSNGIRISKEDLAELGYVSGSVVFDMTIKHGQIILVPKEKNHRRLKSYLKPMIQDYLIPLSGKQVDQLARKSYDKCKEID